ncbi:hypothetical protein QBC43DRAFT_320356 [Cladorrhinum sp. PSN259]|nr:hypothetical protein QBC43DRAFT_320356 [Cladorrhinum sp. PSN259]
MHFVSLRSPFPTAKMARLSAPFLDSLNEKYGSSAESAALVRPWKSYWPPEVDGEVYKTLKKNVPEVLNFRFNPKEPFERPWQWWTRYSPFPGSQACRTTVLGPDKHSQRHKPDSNTPNKLHHEQMTRVLPPSNLSTNEQQQTGTEDVDRVISNLALPFVTPSQFNYLSNDPLYDTVKPFHTRLPFLGQIRRSNIIAQGYPGVRIHDINDHEDEFGIDISGFAFLKLPVDIDQWDNNVARQQYVPLMESWAMKYFKASKVHIYAYTFRCDDKSKSASEAWVSPFMRAHCDVTLNSGQSRLDLHFPDEADEIRKGRWRMFGIWRPLTGPYQDRPLTVLDGRTLAQEDLVGADVVFPHYCDEGYELRHNPAHRWFYKQRMTIDDVIMFKLYDSLPEATKFCAHSAFADPSVPDDTPQRASIEIRIIVVG